jgi:hypothetical protein
LVGLIASAALSANAQRASQANVQELADRWVVAYNKHDRAALGALYTGNGRLMMHGAPTIVMSSAVTLSTAAASPGTRNTATNVTAITGHERVLLTDLS